MITLIFDEKRPEFLKLKISQLQIGETFISFDSENVNEVYGPYRIISIDKGGNRMVVNLRNSDHPFGLDFDDEKLYFPVDVKSITVTKIYDK